MRNNKTLTRLLEQVNMVSDTLKCIQACVGHHDDESWVKATNGRLTIMLAQWYAYPFHLKQAKVNIFKNRIHALDILAATCHVPVVAGIRPKRVDGVAYYDGSLCQDTSSLTRIRRPDDLKDSDLLIGINVASIVGTNQRERCITAGIEYPVLWRAMPPPPKVLWMMHELGYLRALEFLCGDSSIPAIKKRGVELTLPDAISLQGVQQTIETLLAKLIQHGAGPIVYPKTVGKL